MSTRPGPWRVRLTSAAVSDVAQIVRWTEQHFGRRQAGAYADFVEAAFQDLADAGPEGPGTRKRKDIGPGVITLHVRRRGRRGRHFVLFRVGDGAAGDVIEVLRVLHDVMDLTRHLAEPGSDVR